jgi:hypothetical protein
LLAFALFFTLQIIYFIFSKAREKKDGRISDGVEFLSSFLAKIVRSKGVEKKYAFVPAYYFFQNPCGLSFIGI